MTILVSNAPNQNSSQFIYENCKVKDESMKEFAEMVILHALQKYPNDDFNIADAVCQKFEEKYGGSWSTSFIKNGDSSIVCSDYFIKVKYGDYRIKIVRSLNK